MAEVHALLFIAGEHLKMRTRRAAFCKAHFLQRAIGPVGYQGQVDQATVFCNQTIHNGFIAFLHLAMLEQTAQFAVGFFV